MPSADGAHAARRDSPYALQHVGLTVSDLERSLSWYAEVLGGDAGEITVAEGRELARALRVGDHVSLRFAFLETGNTLLELIEYAAPHGERSPRRNCDVGAVHVCFTVDDITAVHERLSRLGVAFSSDPLPLTRGRLRGARYVYFTDPDGIQLQLLQDPSPARVAA
jgi:catechol 2,3-dioxygenase-like lactoylglutathione lyase family enzyme